MNTNHLITRALDHAAEVTGLGIVSVSKLASVPMPTGLHIGAAVKVRAPGGERDAFVAAPPRILPLRGPDGRIIGRGVPVLWVTGGAGPVLAALVRVPERDTDKNRSGGVR